MSSLHRPSAPSLALLALFASVACGEPEGDPSDAGGDGGDAAVADGGTDAGPGDDGGADAGADAGADGGVADAGPVDVCAGVGCSARGRCVVVEGAPTCACDRGAYPAGLSCSPDPCTDGAGACRYVDPTAGDDAGPGTRERPWRTLSHAAVQARSFAPGSYLLLRRGRDYGTEPVLFRGLAGTEALPITVGAYGDASEARPTVEGLGVDGGSAHLTVRDLEVRQAALDCGAPSGGACVVVSDSHDVILQDLYVHGCFSNGIVMGAGTDHTTVVDCRVADVCGNDGITIHDGGSAEADIGDHHWIADNVVGPITDPGPRAEEGIDVAIGGGPHGAAHDVKIVGNAVGSADRGCIMTGYRAEHVWIVGNVVGDCPREMTNGAIHVGANEGGGADVRGNVVFRNAFANLVDSREGAPVRIVSNTFVPEPNFRGTWRFQSRADAVFSRNVVLAAPGMSHLLRIDPPTGLPSLPPGVAESNWYVPNDRGCTLFGVDLATWQSSSGLEAGSRCEAVPGVGAPGSETDPASFLTEPFLASFVPDATWEGCGEGIGALRCDGSRAVEWAPFDDYPDGGGLGWAGPLVIRQRYPLP